MDVASILQSHDRAVLQRFVSNPHVQQKHRDASVFPNGTADLHRSAASGHVNEVRGLLGIGTDPTQTNAEGATPLAIAREEYQRQVAHYIGWEHDELVRVLTRCLGRTPTQIEIYGAATLNKLRRFRQRVRDCVAVATTALLEAARVGDLVTVKRMLERGEIGPNVADKAAGETAWSAALVRGRVAVCMYLRENGARMDGTYWIKGERYDLLTAAVLTGDVGFVRWVVGQGAALVSSPSEGSTSTCALTEAVRLGSIAMVEALLELGVRFERASNGFNLPRPFVFLLQSIEPSSLTDMEAEPWLLLCAACWFQEDMLFYYLLKKHPAFQDLLESPRNAAMVLFLAAYRENEAFVDELLRRGALINSVVTLHSMLAAVLANSTRMLRFLIERGGNVNSTSHDIIKNSGQANSMLEVAVFFDAFECAMLLLPLETRPHHLEQALLWASVRGNVEFAALLLDRLMPLSVSTLQRCTSATACPLLLDLLLSRCCGDSMPISTLNAQFAAACKAGKGSDLLDVYVAHGIEITHNIQASLHRTSRVLDGVRRWTWSNPRTVVFVLAHGMPIVITSRKKQTPDHSINWHYEQRYSTKDSEFKQQCEAALLAYGFTPTFLLN